MKFAPTPVYRIEADPHEYEALPMLRELYSRLPETRCLEPYELQHVLWSLHYCEELIPEVEIAAAVEVARSDYAPEAGAA